MAFLTRPDPIAAPIPCSVIGSTSPKRAIISSIHDCLRSASGSVCRIARSGATLAGVEVGCREPAVAVDARSVRTVPGQMRQILEN